MHFYSNNDYEAVLITGIRYSDVGYKSGLADGTEQLHLFLNSCPDSISARSQKLSWVKAFALLVLACLDVFPGGCCEGQLALCVYIDFCNAQADSLFNHILRDTCTAVKNQRHVAYGCLYLLQYIEAQAAMALHS